MRIFCSTRQHLSINWSIRCEKESWHRIVTTSGLLKKVIKMNKCRKNPIIHEIWQVTSNTSQYSYFINTWLPYFIYLYKILVSAYEYDKTSNMIEWWKFRQQYGQNIVTNFPISLLDFYIFVKNSISACLQTCCWLVMCCVMCNQAYFYCFYTCNNNKPPYYTHVFSHIQHLIKFTHFCYKFTFFTTKSI